MYGRAGQHGGAGLRRRRVIDGRGWPIAVGNLGVDDAGLGDAEGEQRDASARDSGHDGALPFKKESLNATD
jgi:hypothetical protein